MAKEPNQHIEALKALWVQCVEHRRAASTPADVKRIQDEIEAIERAMTSESKAKPKEPPSYNWAT